MNIELKNISYTYNQGTAEECSALKEINLTLGGNQLIAIVGSTGSGKSTLLQILNGLVLPTSGEVLYDGRNIGNNKKELRNIRCRVGMVFQYPEYQLFDETILKDVTFGPKNKGLSKEAAEIAAREALNAVGITEDMFEKSPFELSGGEKRRVAIAGILAMEPEILVLDEPTAGLDPVGKKHILDLVKNYQKDKGLTVIMVSHNMDEVAEYADRIIAMNKGKVMLDGETHEVFKHREELENIGLGVSEAAALTEALGIKDAVTVDEAVDAIFRLSIKKKKETCSEI